jgi:hypothetical protein
LYHAPPLPGANGVSSLPTLRSQVQMHTRATNGRNSTPTNARPPCTLAVARRAAAPPLTPPPQRRRGASPCPCCTATACPRERSSAAAAARRKRRRVGDWEWTLDSGAEPCPSVASLPGCLEKEKRVASKPMHGRPRHCYSVSNPLDRTQSLIAGNRYNKRWS